MMVLRSCRFLCEPIQVTLADEPRFEKRPGCPQEFTWRGNAFRITELLQEWHDYRRRDRMAHNMRPEHAATAERRGSWGGGRDHYQVRTQDGRIFELCYDRAPRDATRRKVQWVISQELAERE